MSENISPSVYSLDQFESHPDCTLCELHEDSRNPGIQTVRLINSLPPQAETPAVIYIGQNPGYHEDASGYPFIGPSGCILHESYIDGISLTDIATVYATNIVRCVTTANAKPKWVANVKRCIPYTLTDIDLILSTHHSSLLNAIVCIGAPASETIMTHLGGQKRPSQKTCFGQNGTTFPVPSDNVLPRNVTIFHFYHPAYFMRNPNILYAVHDHNQLLLNFLTGTFPGQSSPNITAPFTPPS